MLRLDQEQFQVLVGLDENDFVLVAGEAGTGKTIVAGLMALRLVKRGEKVLFLCYTVALARWLAETIRHPNLTVRAIKNYAVDLLRSAELEVKVCETPEFYGDVSLRAATEALPRIQTCWDTVLVDEGQDLAEDDWLLIEKLSSRRIWAFWDPEQVFWSDRTVREDLFKARYRLGKAYRCPDAILALARCYAGESPGEGYRQQALQTGIIGVRACPSRSSVQTKIEKEIDKFLAEGLKPGEIAVLSLRGRETESIVRSPKLGDHRIVKADEPSAESHVVAETFLRFKGLERPAIIITDVHLALDKEDYPKRMYIALTPTLATVRIVDDRQSLLRDQVLSRWIQDS